MKEEQLSALELFEGRTLKLIHQKDNELILLFNDNYKITITGKNEFSQSKSGHLIVKPNITIEATKPLFKPGEALDRFNE